MTTERNSLFYNNSHANEQLVNTEACCDSAGRTEHAKRRSSSIAFCQQRRRHAVNYVGFDDNGRRRPTVAILNSHITVGVYLRKVLTLCLLLIMFFSSADAVVVTIAANSEDCYFVPGGQSVTSNSGVCSVAWQTQSGDSLDIDVDVHDPRENLVFSALGQSEGHTAFMVGVDGRYRICFSNVVGSNGEKRLAFIIRCHAPSLSESTSLFESEENEQGERSISMHMAFGQMVDNITSDLTVLSIMLLNVLAEQREAFQRMLGHRTIAEHTNSSVVWFSTFEFVSVACVAVLQIVFLRR